MVSVPGFHRWPNTQQDEPAGQGQGRGWENLGPQHGRWNVRRLSLPGSSKPLARVGLAPRVLGQHAPPTFPWLEAWTRLEKGSQYPKELRALAAHGTQVRGCWRKGSVLESSGEEADPTELLGNEAKPWGRDPP